MTDLCARLRERHGDSWPIRIGEHEPINRDGVEAAERIEKLTALLRRIDAVTTWEDTPLGRDFQPIIEAALREDNTV